jgi:hypothetical protein
MPGLAQRILPEWNMDETSWKLDKEDDGLGWFEDVMQKVANPTGWANRTILRVG